MSAKAKKDESVADEAPAVVERVSPVVTIGDGVASVAFGDQVFDLDAGQVHRLRRDLNRAFMELS